MPEKNKRHAPQFNELPPLSLYIHIPWCIKKCPYCDFNSHAAPTELPEQQYVAALINDLNNDLDFVQGRKLKSIFFGGGTPSLFKPASMAAILQAAEQQIGFTDNIEITLEANPGTFEQQKFSAFRETGINRLSIGIQSFNQQQLQRLGRVHNSAEALQAIEMARQAGFDNFNLDLMHGLPEQNIEQAMADLQTAIELSPTHLSWYQLTIEANTEFYKHPPQLPCDDARWDIFEQGQLLLAEHGYQQYEVSAYSQSGKASQHNLNYWQFGDYLGIGAGAHGKITQLETTQQPAQIIRTRKTRAPNDYLNQITAHQHIEVIASEDITGEFMMNALRLNEGFTAEHFEQYSGLESSEIDKGLAAAHERGLITVTADNLIQPSSKGRLFLDDLVALFI
ncbi:MAG: radical SAM family heme chaperone HemW [Pseudomonadales bacterium]